RCTRLLLPKRIARSLENMPALPASCASTATTSASNACGLLSCVPDGDNEPLAFGFRLSNRAAIEVRSLRQGPIFPMEGPVGTPPQRERSLHGHAGSHTAGLLGWGMPFGKKSAPPFPSIILRPCPDSSR